MTQPLYTGEEIARATGGQLHGGDWSVQGISIDTRTLNKGDIYVALKGDTHDGHNYVGIALEKGATGLLVSTPIPGQPCVVVPDTEAALRALAAYNRSRSNARIIGITGSSGKTTTKEMMQLVASGQKKTHATLGNLNNHIGLPLTLARMPQDTELGVFELGMNHANEILPLTKLLQPHVALISTVGSAHIENFPDGQTGIVKAKAEIFAGLQPGGIAVLPHDNPHYAALLTEAQRYNVGRTLSFGEKTGSDACLNNLTLSADHSNLQATLSGRNLNLTLPVAGAHMAMNALGVLLAAHALGLDTDKAVAALASFHPPKGRGVIKHFGPVTVIDDGYNANPQSMRAGLAVLGLQQGGRRIAVLGNMNELGAGIATTEHAGLKPDLQQAGVAQLFCCGPDMKALWDVWQGPGHWAATAAELAPVVAAALQPQDIVFIKGSRGQQVNIKGVMSPTMAQVTAAIETRFTPAPAKEPGPHAA